MVIVFFYGRIWEKPKPKNYLINYSFSTGNGSFTVHVPDGGELDMGYVIGWLENNQKILGNKVVHSFQEISERQYEDWNN